MKMKIPAAVLLLILAASSCRQASAYVQLPTLTPWSTSSKGPVSNWLLSQEIPSSKQLAWRKLGSKLWTFLANLDHDFVNPTTGVTVHPSFPGARRAFGPSVTCGRFARQFVRMPFHDCSTYDVGNTGSFGDTGKPRFGCNGSLRKEVGPCLDPRPQACVNGVEARFDLATGAFLAENPFKSVEDRYGKTFVDWAQDPTNPRPENFGFGMALAFFYQLKYETQYTEPSSLRISDITMADMIVYAGFLGTAKCGGPHIVFEPGRPDTNTLDPFNRLPAPIDSAWRSLSYFWTNGLTNMDVVVLTSSHSLACFAAGCLDSTPSVYDLGWARNVASVTSMEDPRLCKFTPTGPIPDPSGQCILVPDAQLNARADTRVHLQAILGTVSVTSAAWTSKRPTCTRQTGAPVCASQSGVPSFKGFSLLSYVNLCNSRHVANGCPSKYAAGGSDIVRQNDMFASTFYRMGKLYAIRGVNKGAPYGVQTQPCQPGTIKVGGTPFQEGISSRCQCCPNPPPQTFGGASAAAASSATADAVVTEAGAAAATAAAASTDAAVTEAADVTAATAADATLVEVAEPVAAASTAAAPDTETTDVAAAQVVAATGAEPVVAAAATADEEPAIDAVAAAEAIRARTAAWAALYLGPDWETLGAAQP